MTNIENITFGNGVTPLVFIFHLNLYEQRIFIFSSQFKG